MQNEHFNYVTFITQNLFLDFMCTSFGFSHIAQPQLCLVGHSVSSTQEAQLQRNSLGSWDWILRLNIPPGQTRSRTNGAIPYVHVLQSDHDWHFNLWQFSGMPIAEHLVKPGIFFATPHFEMWEPRVCLPITHTWWCAFQECRVQLITCFLAAILQLRDTI